MRLTTDLQRMLGDSQAHLEFRIVRLRELTEALTKFEQHPPHAYIAVVTAQGALWRAYTLLAEALDAVAMSDKDGEVSRVQVGCRAAGEPAILGVEGQGKLE